MNKNTSNSTYSKSTKSQTEEIHVANSKEQLLHIIKFMPVAIALLDKEMKYIAHSEQWVKDYNLGNKNIIGLGHYEVFPEILQMPEWLSIHQSVLKGGAYYTKKDRFVRKDDQIQWLSYTVSPWMDEAGKVGGLIMVTADITDEVNHQENIDRRNRELEEKVKERTNKLERKKEQLSLHAKELKEFAHVVSHDLQEPLRTVMGYLAVLEEDFYEEIPKDAKVFIQESINAADRMQTLINDLLVYTKVTNKDQHWLKVDLNTIVEEVLMNLSASIEATKANIAYATLPVIEADPSHMRQLFQNLISNAIKYRKENISPLISIDVVEKEEEYLFFVSDNGIGMEEKYRNRIFRIFQRLHHRDVYNGTGVGLAICKRIVEKHKGKIWVDSQNGIGSTFKFTLGKNP